ncbi:MAG TPA: hypothetical protein VFR18_19675, partial [Terriglobia bacterium]|nr:hypothetical protein [Terriglobia bacterium]
IAAGLGKAPPQGYRQRMAVDSSEITYPNKFQRLVRRNCAAISPALRTVFDDEELVTEPISQSE